MRPKHVGKRLLQTNHKRMNGDYYQVPDNWSRLITTQSARDYMYRATYIKQPANKQPMTIIEKIRLAAKTEPEKSFIKAGITNMDGSFTSEGKEAFLSYLLEKNKDDFNTTIVQPLLAEEVKA